MRNHDYAEGLVQEHPAISKFKRHLKTNDLVDSTVDFLGSRAYFAYPKTLWIKLAVDQTDDSAEKHMRFRHSLNPEKTAETLGSWMTNWPAMRNIVFDLSDVTIFDANKITALLQQTHPAAGGQKFCVAQGEMADNLRGLGIEAKSIFATERELLCHLRDVPKANRCVVSLPEHLTMRALDDALKTQATKDKLKQCDVVALDLSEVDTITFKVHSMLAPAIHSLSHSDGILATIIGERPRVIRDIAAHGSLRPMRSNLIQVQQDYLRRLDEPPVGDRGIFSMRTFTADESVQLQHLAMQRLDELFKYYISWLSSLAKIPQTMGQPTVDRIVTTQNRLRAVIKELIDNVAQHAHGLGYFMMELNPMRDHGLRIYVGDTGIGLAHGIRRSYRKGHLTHVNAVKMAMSLGDQFTQRRRQPGTLAFGGRGLEQVGVILRALKGTIEIRTGNAAAEFSPEDARKPIKIFDNMYDIQGTHIQIKIPSRWEDA